MITLLKNCIVVFVVEAGHTVKPSACDRIGLAGTGTVLDEIVTCPAPLVLIMIDQLTHDIQLVIPWGNDFLLTVFFVDPSGKVSFFPVLS